MTSFIFVVFLFGVEVRKRIHLGPVVQPRDDMIGRGKTQWIPACAGMTEGRIVCILGLCVMFVIGDE